MNQKTNIQVLAYPVTDLTIARYLAAKSVNFIGIPVDPNHPDESFRLIQTFKEWLEGPQLIAVCYAAEEVCNALWPAVDGFMLPYEHQTCFNGICFQPTRDHALHAVVDKPVWRCSLAGEPGEGPSTFIEMDLEEDPSQFPTCTGFVIHPGRESKTGIFDFDLLERWFERLEAMQENGER